MNINSTEEERYNEIKDRILTVIPWDLSKEMVITDGSKSYSRAVKDFATSLNLTAKPLTMEGFNYPVKFTNNSIKESIRQTHDLTSLSKLFTVLHDVAINAIRVEVEPYRHNSHPKKSIVKQNHQYLSGFCDEYYAYPVKFSVEERIKSEDTYAYVTITVGKIKKEALSYTGIPDYSGRAPSNGVTSFDINIADFVKYFNREQSVIIKNIPNQMLSLKQQALKEKVIKCDREKEEKIAEIKNQMNELKEKLSDIENETYDDGFEMDV